MASTDVAVAVPSHELVPLHGGVSYRPPPMLNSTLHARFDTVKTAFQSHQKLLGSATTPGRLNAMKKEYCQKYEEASRRADIQPEESESFLNHDGSPMTAEQLQADLDEDEADDSADESETPDFNTYYSGIKQALENPPKIKREVLMISFSVVGTFHRAWKDGSSSEVKRVLHEANDRIAKLRRSGSSRAASIAVDSLLEKINSIHDMLLLLGSGGDEQTMGLCARQVALNVLSMIPELDKCGLKFCYIVDPAFKPAVEFLMNLELQNADGDMTPLIQAYQRREQKALHAQKQIIRPAKETFQQFFDACRNGQSNEAHQAIGELNELNNKLSELNSALGMDTLDHSLPGQLINTCANMATTGAQTPQMTESLGDLKQFLYSFLIEGGFYESPQELEDLLASERTLKDSDRQNLDTIKRGWTNAVPRIAQRLTDTPASKDTPMPDAPLSQPKTSDSSSLFVRPNSSTRRTFGPAQGRTTRATAQANAGHIASTTPGRTNANDGLFRAKQETDTVAPTRPPVFTGIPGPLPYKLPNTPLGKVVGVRKAGLSLKVFLNAGTESCPVYKCVNASNFGHGTSKDIAEEFGVQERYDIKQRKAQEVDRVLAYVEVEQRSIASRTPVRFFLIKYSEDPARNPLTKRPYEEWISRSDAITLLGRRNVDGPTGYYNRLLAQEQQKLRWLDHCKYRDMNPDTGNAITDAEKETWPWLFPDAVEPSSASVENRKQSEMGNPLSVGVGDGWTPPSTDDTDEEM